MWALIDKETQIVIGALMPDAPLKEIEKAKTKWDLIPMTLENSPATIGNKYLDGKFYSIQGETNG